VGFEWQLKDWNKKKTNYLGNSFIGQTQINNEYKDENKFHQEKIVRGGDPLSSLLSWIVSGVGTLRYERMNSTVGKKHYPWVNQRGGRHLISVWPN